MSDDLSLVDTNILVYAYDKSERDRYRICNDLVKKCWMGKKKYSLSIQNISEFFVVITSKIEKPIPMETAQKTIERIIEFANWIKIKPDVHTISSAIKISRRYDVHYWDGLLAATMRENGVFSIYTENEDHFKQIPWLKVVNPIKGC